jgi:thiamine-phosphate diphosphorylase
VEPLPAYDAAVKSPWRSPLYAILNLPHAGGLELLEAGRGLLAGGCGVLQVRSKTGFAGVDEEQLAELAELAAKKGVPFILNDDLVACEQIREQLPDARVGVHLGQEDLATLGGEAARSSEQLGYWGLSTHNLKQLEATRLSSAAYLGFGPVFATQSKVDTEPVAGLELLERACRSSLHPIVAIGGLDADRGLACLGAGAVAVACISALVADSAVRIESRCGELLATLMMR